MKRLNLNFHLGIFIFATFVLTFVSSQFAKATNSFFAHPQFRPDYQFSLLVQTASEVGSFKWYFYIDAVWAFLGLSLLLHTIMEKLEKSFKQSLYFFIVAVIAYALDLWEAIGYLYPDSMSPSLLATVQDVKVGAYALAVVIFLYYLYERWRIKADNDQELKEGIPIFFKTSYISLLIIAIVLILMTQMEQGKTIIVDLYSRPMNIIGVYLVVLFMAINLSHFPAYLETKRKCFQHFTWCMVKGWIPPRRTLGFGIIYYDDQEQRSPFNRLSKILRHHLGTFLICVFTYLLLFVGDSYFKDFSLSPNLSLAMFIAGIWLYQATSKSEKITMGHIKKLTLLSGGLTIVLVAIICFLDRPHGWSRVNVALSFAACVTMLLFYLFFRLSRKEFSLTRNQSFVRLIAVVGMLSLIPLILANASPINYASGHMNPLLILLLYLSNFYGLIIIIVKHLRFYNESSEKCKDNVSQVVRTRYAHYKYLIPAVIVFFGVWMAISVRIKNDLHSLKLVKDKETHFTIDDFIEKLPAAVSDDSLCSKPYFQVASYGGGLKAALWTLNVVNQLQLDTDAQFLQSTMTMSGNSGGANGLAGYASMWAYGVEKEMPLIERPKVLRDRITEYGRFNHIAIDLTYLFGRDLIREFIPFWNHKGTDRSYVSAKEYARFVGMPPNYFRDLSFKDYWKLIYNRSDYYPALITSSASTDGKQGIAFSLQSPEPFQLAFPGAVSLLDQPECCGSPTYFGAVSSSNRFPIFSPTAQIEGKGHFLDGGYFDNSGLTSLIGLQQYIERYLENNKEKAPALRKRKPVFVIIDNSKDRYISDVLEHHLEHYMDTCKDINAVGEFAAVLQTLVYIDKIPKYLEGMVENNYGEFIRINLPQPISYDDVVSALKGHPYKPHTIMDIVEKANKEIDSVLQSDSTIYDFDQWGVVNPPLARLISEPGVRYMEIMVKKHPRVQKKIQQIRNAMKCKRPNLVESTR